MALKDKAAKIDLTKIGNSVSVRPIGQGAKTAIGLHADALFRDEKVSEENLLLKERLSAFDGALPVRLIDPWLIDASPWANRSEASFDTPEFDALKNEIEASSGNVQPIKVRPCAGGRFEVVYGHRRHRACRDLGIQVLSLVEAVDDAQLFAEMDRENRERQSLRPFETGVMYARALDAGLFTSAKKLAEAISVDLTYVGRALKLARLPEDVVKAFRSPLDLQFSWASDLSDALQRDPDGVLDRARALGAAEKKLPAKEVLSVLVKGGSTVLPPKTVTLTIRGKQGCVGVKASGLDAVKLQVLEKAIREVLDE